MGTTIRTDIGRGKSMLDAWKNLVADDKEENGSGYYNGVLSSCDTPTEVKELPVEDKVEKRSSYGKCRKPYKPNTNKIKSEVVNFPCKATRKWETRYVAVTKFRGEEVVEANSQAECIKKARLYVEKNQGMPLEIQIRKVLVGMNDKVAEVKYKGSSTEQLGEWEFISGVAI